MIDSLANARRNLTKSRISASDFIDILGNHKLVHCEAGAEAHCRFIEKSLGYGEWLRTGWLIQLWVGPACRRQGLRLRRTAARLRTLTATRTAKSWHWHHQCDALDLSHFESARSGLGSSGGPQQSPPLACAVDEDAARSSSTDMSVQPVDVLMITAAKHL